MAVINPQPILNSAAALQPVYTGVNASDTLVNNGNSFLHVKNGNGSNCTVTVAGVNACSQGGTHDVVVSVPLTTGDRMIGPFPVSRFGNSPTVTYSQTVTVTAALISLPT